MREREEERREEGLELDNSIAYAVHAYAENFVKLDSVSKATKKAKKRPKKAIVGCNCTENCQFYLS